MVAHPCRLVLQPALWLNERQGEAVLGTNNRNFIGRIETIKSLIYQPLR